MNIRLTCICLFLIGLLILTGQPMVAWASTLGPISSPSKLGGLTLSLLTQRVRKITSHLGALQAMAPEVMEALIDQARDSWIAGNAEAFSALFAPDGEFIVPGQRWVGQEAIHRVAAEFAATHSNVEVSIHTLVLGDGQAVVEWVWKDVETATGSRTEAEDAIVVDFKAGKITRWREYIDAESPKANK
ncbi:MAG: SgcJ/EcaC family oxidoreductase [Kovacikia sp.]